MTNVDLLERTLGHIETNPEQWNQRHWAVRKPACGTAFCFAGTAAVLAHPGAKPAFEGGMTVAGFMSIPTDPRRPRFISELAREELGLDESDASVLFDVDNTLEHLRSMVAKLVAGEHLSFDDYDYPDGDEDGGQ